LRWRYRILASLRAPLPAPLHHWSSVPPTQHRDVVVGDLPEQVGASAAAAAVVRAISY
jgi:hypothetical protein